MDKLSWRDRIKIRSEIAEKLVDKICSGLINNEPLVNNLRESLGNEMLGVLNNPENKSKISQTVLQAINTSIELPLRGPLLLYALMDNDKSYEYTKNMVTFIFGQIYKENDTISSFSGRLVEKLNDPPYDSWFKNVNNISGGKKCKTKRKRNKTKSKRKYSRKRKMYGGVESAALDAATSVATSEGASAVTDAVSSEGIDAVSNEGTDAVKDVVSDAVDNVKEEGGEEENESKEGDTESDEEKEDNESKEGDKEKSSGTPSSGSSSGSTSMFSSAPNREMTGSEITQNADELVTKYNEALFTLISKDLNTVKSQILQRMLNACYLHATNNSNVILTSITSSIGNIVQQSMNKGVLQYDYPNFIILVQALRPAYKDIINALSTTYMNQKQKASDEGKKEEVKFNPNDTQFITDFMSNFKTVVSKQINLDLTGSG